MCATSLRHHDVRDNRAMHPFTFFGGSGEIVDGRTLAEQARRAEAAGYDALVIPDHLLDQLAPLPALATIAAATDRLRVGTFVLNNDLRHPAVLAQELATIDVLSGGRLIVGMGAGWNRPEYDAIGLPFDAVGARAARLEESITVLKGLFGDAPLTHHGAQYRITALDGQPKPVQRPHPPFLIGGGGRRTLTLAGREAQIVGLAPRPGRGGTRDLASYLASATEEKIGWVREAAGARFPELVLNTYPSMSPVIVTDHALREAHDLAARANARSATQATAEELLDSPHIFIGTIDALVDKIVGLREQFGISSVMLDDVDALAPIVERLAGR
jgi:probable F420-dependent oxidoreductase